jgi:outer membrane scaffolding protein for murein synthesis (MipA/OmpV family)
MNATAVCKSLLATVLVATCHWAQAQAFDAVRLYGVPEGDSAGIVGAVVISAPEYMGSDERRILVLPSIDYQWKNGWFAGLANGIGYQFPSRPDIQFGLRVTADLGRQESRTAALNGMGDIEIRPEAGVFFNYFPTAEVFLTSSLRYGAGNDRNGMQIDLGAGYANKLAAQWRAAVGVAATWVNADYMQAFFGVTPQQAAASGYAAYSAGSGLRDVRINGSLTYFIDARWSVTGALTVRSLQGDARDSPIVFENTPVSGVLALSYGF